MSTFKANEFWKLVSNRETDINLTFDDFCNKRICDFAQPNGMCNINAVIKANIFNNIIFNQILNNDGFQDINKILENIIKSKCKYFAVSRYNNGNVINIDRVSSLNAQAIEITQDPFYFNYKIIESIRYTDNINISDEIIIFEMY